LILLTSNRKGRIYVPQGAPCNVCNPDLPSASLSSMNTTGGDFIYHARGIRNTVGFDWHPQRDELWFTDNGRDGWGNSPGDELNVIYPTAKNETPHYGFPFCYAKGIIDTTFNNVSNCNAYIPAKYELGPHVAALGKMNHKLGI
jgi:glucose/arabinose dehydrogenase